ncbi:MAG: DNA translocase FtsK 4TM domain-containing protein [Paludibacter sp.]|nr:DNA translocase FtsK 4TM domain-containing protein [Paludibacter sp.]
MAPRKPVKTVQKPEQKPQKKSSTAKNPGFFKNFAKNISGERILFILGLLLFFVVIYFTLAFVSYFFTGANDQSHFDLSWSELQQKRDQIQNWTSVTGALVAHTMIHKWFGISSVAILFFAAIFALRLMSKRTFSLWKSFFHAAFWLICLSVTLGFAVNPLLNDVIFFSPGGQHGEAVSDLIVSYIGYPGTILSLIGLFIVYGVIVSAQTIPFIKNLFSRKPKTTALSPVMTDVDDYDDELFEPSVAVGTEIIPEDWIVRPASNEETFTVTPKTAPDNDVEFEIQNQANSIENKPVDATNIENKNEENDDPFYNISKLGKYDPKLDLSHYVPPTLDLLKIYGTDNDTQIDMVEQNANKERIIQTLQNYGIEIKTIKATVGPTITLYEIVPKEGVRISKIRNLEYDIMLSLAATGIRIIAPIPGKGTIGIEVPNADPQIVSMHSVIASKRFQESTFELPIAFGRTITNEIFMVDLAKMPHLLVAGATGQGKSVGLNAIITSLLYKKHPSEMKFVLVDPKKVEFNIYADIEKHFLAKLPDGNDAIITDVTKVVETLNSLCMEMDDRYDLLKKAHVRNIREYNEKFFNRNLNPEKGHRFLPYIVVIVDEFGDLIMTAGKEVEMPIARIAQLARAVGIHMIIATQRPSVNIITGVIKANFPARIGFKVSSMIDSRTILDASGANQLVGRGDMLFSQGNDLIRVQCAFVDTPEVENVVHHIGNQRGYPTAFYLPEYIGKDSDSIELSNVDLSKRDPLFEEAARLIVASQQGSTSSIQRKFSIGYNRAGRIVDQLEVAGIIGPFEGSKARQVLVMDEYHLEKILKHI